MKRATASALVGVWLGVSVAPPAWALDLEPHRALYTMKLATSREGSDITSLSGKMYIEWADSCDGWTVNQQVLMTFVGADAPTLSNAFSFSSWESKDGKSFRYNMRNSSGGQTIEKVVGRAKMPTDSGEGSAAFDTPEVTTLDLPDGTIFPTEHLLIMIEQGLAGNRQFTRTVFNGTGLDSLNEVVTFIGPRITPGSRPIAGDVPDEIKTKLGARPSWPVSMGYFPMDAANSEPEFEVRFRLIDNGVSDALVLDYGSYAIDATLSQLEILPPPKC